MTNRLTSTATITIKTIKHKPIIYFSFPFWITSHQMKLIAVFLLLSTVFGFQVNSLRYIDLCKCTFHTVIVQNVWLNFLPYNLHGIFTQLFVLIFVCICKVL